MAWMARGVQGGGDPLGWPQREDHPEWFPDRIAGNTLIQGETQTAPRSVAWGTAAAAGQVMTAKLCPSLTDR
jgi:hypothetical protein